MIKRGYYWNLKDDRYLFIWKDDNTAIAIERASLVIVLPDVTRFTVSFPRLVQ